MERLLLATQNLAKVREFTRLFELLGIPTEFLLAEKEEPSWHVLEEGNSFAEIALHKARMAAEHFNIPTLADDGGLEIDALSGEPGIFSRRWPGYAADDETLLDLALEKLRGVPDEHRGAQFRAAVAIAEPGGNVWVEEGILRGYIAREVHPKREAGYPFRSIFIVPELGKYAIELSDEELLALGHRRIALEKLMQTAPFFKHVKAPYVPFS